MRTMSVGPATIRSGTVQSEPLVTPAGSVSIESRGVVIDSPWGGVRWLHPTRVEAIHPNGRRESTAVRDVTQRVLLTLLTAGLIVTWVGSKIQRSRRRA